MKVFGWYRGCLIGRMMTVFCIALAIVAAGLLTEMFATATAPFGYQDESGFHFGQPNTAQPASFDIENPS